MVSTPACEYIQAVTFKVDVMLPIYFSNILCGFFMWWCFTLIYIITAENMRTKIATVSPTKKVSPAPRNAATSLQTANTRKIGRKIELELIKGVSGLGFSITTRDNPAGGNCPIYIKNILQKVIILINCWNIVWSLNTADTKTHHWTLFFYYYYYYYYY